MTKTLGILLLLVVFLFTANAQNTKKPAGRKADVKIVNTKCPVTGEDVDPAVTYTYKGRTYAFCCNGCVARFKKTPESFLKNMKDEKFEACDHPEGEAPKAEVKEPEVVKNTAGFKGVINTGRDMSAQIVNEICPVMGKKVDKNVTTVTYNGKVYGFCCGSCIKKFAMDPEKYLKNAK